MYQVNFFSDKHVSFLRDALHIFCKLLLMLTCLLVVVPAPSFAAAKTDAAPSRFTPPQDDRASVIIEVEGDAKQHREYLRNYFPNTEIIAVYDTLFNGLAIKTKPEKLAKIASLEFVKAIHPVATYQANFSATAGMTKTKKLKDMLKTDKNAVLPQTLNTTSYTGKGIKVGIIDTGIDYNHPDLRNNYQGGYDLVDLDDDPMETTPEQGAPTLHGTHVAGIIAADGDLKGVAPDASIYSYRALGPGGSGTSAQVIAALEQAVKDGMDVVNLSLGNTVNGPDYPTSIAVNKAYELGVFVVIANGNDGPGDWTVGSPATAVKSFSVGALANEQQIPVLAARHENLQIHMTPMLGSVPWELQRDYAVTTDLSQARGKIALLKRGKIPFYELAKQAEENGAVAVLIYNNEPGAFQGSIETDASESNPIAIPVASLTKKDGKKLTAFSEGTFPYLETKQMETPEGIAAFSSRGPVTVNWQIKPNVLAPGTNIVSTVPGGYEALQGTSMASPHVAGAVALLKEAHPNWSNDKIAAALETTAKPIDSDGKLLAANSQGMGEIQVKAAVHPETVIYNGALVFGKTDKDITRLTTEITIENTSNEKKTYYFAIPKIQKGLSWQLPNRVTIEPKQTKKLHIQANLLPRLLKKGMHQGWLELSDGEQDYHLPYLFINQTVDSPKAAGFEFLLKPFSEEAYMYRFYLSEDAKKVQAILYDPDTLVYKKMLLDLKDVSQGMNEGKIDKKDVPAPGKYRLLFMVQTENGSLESDEIPVEISS